MNQVGASGGAPVTNGGTDGGAENRPSFRFPPLLWAIYAVLLAVFAAIVGSSYWLEAQRVGLQIPAWHIVVNEATSIVIVFAVTPLVFAWAERLDPRRIGWPRTLLGHLAGAIAFGIVHIGGMTLMRVSIYPLFGDRYGIDWDSLGLGLLYEGRKDALAYAAMVLGAWLLAAALRKPKIVVTQVMQTAPTSAARRIEIRDGTRRVWIEPAEILWIEAAGNYVELHLAGRSHLQRQTLSALEDELADQGFVRIHRSRLVNRRHVRATESNDSGDFTVTLSDGRQIAGGRRWRDAVRTSG